MIRGIGVDITHVDRFERWIGDENMMARYFHPREVADVLSKGSGGQASLAVRFAAKEAFGKALGTGMRDLKLKDIWVRPDALGKPSLVVEGPAKHWLEEIGVRAIHLSLSHDGGLAIAMVVLES